MSAEVRTSAIDPAGSFLVQAPAGSGKTELLTQRILRLLAVVDEPEEILALTFTRKAAAEMRGRVIDALTMSKPDTSSPHKMETWLLAQEANRRSEECGWHLAEHPSRLNMMTLDSFTHALARQLPLLSGFGEMPVPSMHVMPLYREAAEQAVAMLVRRNHEQAAAILLHQDHNMVALIDLVAEMLGKRDQWLHEVELNAGNTTELKKMLESGLAEIMGQKLSTCIGLMPPEAKAELPGLIAFAAGNRGDTELGGLQQWPGDSLADLPLWQTVAGELMTVTGFRKPRGINVNRGFPPDREFAGQKKQFQEWLERLAGVDGLEAALSELMLLPARPLFDDSQWQVLEAQLQLLLLADRQLQRLFDQRGEADFIEIALRAMRAMEDDQGRPTDLLLRLDYRIRHILVDEFQDTSLLQLRLLHDLTGGWQAGDGTHRSLFMVGDPMQSIYRFRKAEVGLFLLAAANRAGLPPVKALSLTRNFRSSPAIVDWVNQAFAGIFPDEPDILLAAVDHAKAHAALQHDGEVRLHLQQKPDRSGEAAAVVATIRQALKSEKQRIAILSRSRKHLHAIMQALTGAGIAFRAVDILPLHERPEIRLLRALLRALLHPADRESWAALLRTPCCGVDTTAMHRLLAGDERPVYAILDDERRMAQISEDARQRAGFLKQAVAPCLQSAGRVPARTLLARAWHRLGMPGLVAADALCNVEAMLNLVEEVDTGGLINFAILDERLQKLYAGPDTSPEAARVELLTMHGAKGLQWDVVILPGLGYGRGRSDSPLVAFTDVPVADGVQPLIAVRGAVRSNDAIYDLVRSVEKIRENNELARLLYVASTRAKRALHMFGHLKEDSEEATNGSLLKLLLPHGIDNGCFGAEVTMLEAPDAGSGEMRSCLKRIRVLPLAVEHEAEPVDTAESEYFWAGPEAAPVGNAVHAALQHIAEKGIEHWKTTDTVGEINRMRRLLIAEGLSGEMLESAMRRSESALYRVLESPRGTWLLSGLHNDAHSEWELSSRHKGVISHHIIDRSFIDTDGVRWIVDYKTGSHAGGDLEQFLGSEQQRHTRQLEGYRALLQRMEPQRCIRVGLYFPVVDGWREL
ncbi:MAG: UvrD-helicase domain-containing protein [Mariprofundaceae bacterium]|nr:UvrD-helicase domain-containing protein [Mariprofundaceae bacterium]